MTDARTWSALLFAGLLALPIATAAPGAARAARADREDPNQAVVAGGGEPGAVGASDRCRVERPDAFPVGNSQVACWLTQTEKVGGA